MSVHTSRVPPDIQESLRPPSEADIASALAEFTNAVREHYGERLGGLFVFGSRARGSHRPDSDVDVAVVIADGPWNSLTCSIELAGLAFEPLVRTGVEIQPRAVPASRWKDPSGDPEEQLLRRIRAEARPLAGAP